MEARRVSEGEVRVDCLSRCFLAHTSGFHAAIRAARPFRLSFCMPFSWLRTRRRNRLTSQPFPHEWRDVLTSHVRHYQYLSSELRDRLEDFIQVLIAEKDWAATRDFQLTDEMKVAIAGYAGIMTLGLPEPYYFDRLKTIIINDTPYQPAGVEQRGYLAGRPDPRYGESHQFGPIKLSWRAIAGRHRLPPGNNLVIHEFAHHIDGLDGAMDGTPAIGNREKRRAWHNIIEQEFTRLRTEAIHHQATLLDYYGASNRAEFFAVASECFFERPRAMRDRHHDLYQILADFYCQDVAAWLPDVIE
jgi:MtfA peptidase